MTLAVSLSCSARPAAFPRRLHGEALLERGLPQSIVQADAYLPVRLFLAPHQRGGELKGIGRHERVKCQEPRGAPAQLVSWRDRIGVVHQLAQVAAAN